VHQETNGNQKFSLIKSSHNIKELFSIASPSSLDCRTDLWGFYFVPLSPFTSGECFVKADIPGISATL